MASFTAKDVQALRKQTGAGMMDAKRALENNDGDFGEAAKWLREKGIAKSASRSDRANNEGVVAAVISDDVVAAVEIKCETDFVAKSSQFIALADELASLVAEQGVDAVAERASDLETMQITLKENIELGRVVRFEAAEGDVLNGYVHVQNGRGVNVVLVHLSGGSPEVARDIAMHAAFSRPRWVRVEQIPSEVVETEREALLAVSRNEGKPEAALGKIVDGRMAGFYRESVLLEQKWVKDEKQTISQLLGGNEIRNFSQIEIGA